MPWTNTTSPQQPLGGLRTREHVNEIEGRIEGPDTLKLM